MTIHIGADSLCWHLRLEQGELTASEMLREAAAAGAASVQLNLHHVRGLSAAELRELSGEARVLGLSLLASGDFLGAARRGDPVAVGVNRIAGWLAQAAAVSSPVLRVVSGFYRAELASQPDLIAAERRYVTEVLREAAPAASAARIRLLLENHSDFSVDEYRQIVEDVGSASVGVFLDLINPVSALEDPVPVVRALAPFAYAGHTKDYVFESIQTDDAYHRRGFSVLYRYPGEGVAPHDDLFQALREGVGDRDFHICVEGLDNRRDVADQVERLGTSFALLRGLLGQEPASLDNHRQQPVG